LLVGISTYQVFPQLPVCVEDAKAIASVLHRHKDGTMNYTCKTLLNRTENGLPMTRAALRDACEELFQFDGDTLFYFSGHGVLANGGGYLCTTDGAVNDWGVAMQEVVDMAIRSRSREVVLIIDCCHSGDVGNQATFDRLRLQANPLTTIREGMTVIAASRNEQVALAAKPYSVFTAAVLDALEGGAADHLGWVTAPAVYAYVSNRFAGWEQRPVYKSNVVDVPVLRECEPLIERLKLRRLVDLFKQVDHRYPLDPEHEPEDEHGNVKEPVNQEKVEIARLFKDYRDAGLLKPTIPGQQLYWTARKNGTVELTPRGKEYWWLVANDKL